MATQLPTNYPGKKRKTKFFVIFALVIAAVILYFASTYSKKTIIQVSGDSDQSGLQADQTQADSLKSTLLSETDSDGDGLPDWQEVLWNSDPYNLDTSGDGIPDGTEVEQNRDPRIPAPNNLLSETSSTTPVTQTQDTSADTEPATYTELVAQEIFSKYLALRDANGNVDPDTINTMVTNLLQESTFQPQYTTYTQGDLSVGQQDDPATIKAYGNNIEEIIERYSPASEPKSELEIVNDSLENNDTAELSQLNPIAAGYQNILQAELNLVVPPTAVSVQIQFLNALAEVLSNIQDMEKVYTDPVLSVRGVTYYATSANDLNNAIQALNTYFTENGVVSAE